MKKLLSGLMLDDLDICIFFTGMHLCTVVQHQTCLNRNFESDQTMYNCICAKQMQLNA